MRGNEIIQILGGLMTLITLISIIVLIWLDTEYTFKIIGTELAIIAILYLLDSGKE